MKETGVHNGAFGADKFGFKNLRECTGITARPRFTSSRFATARPSSPPKARCARRPALTPAARRRTSSPSAMHRRETNVWWGGNQSITPDQFKLLCDDFLKHAEGKTLYAQDLYGGADPKFRIKTRVFTELAWHSLFIRTCSSGPRLAELASFAPEFTIVTLPIFKADPERDGVRSETVVAIDFTRKIVLIGGTSYAGEIKKSVFTMLNYLLPDQRRVADALLGQRRPDGRHRDLLRPLRHRQDDAVGRSEPHADRRRRARLERRRRLQLRRRLLRQVHQALAGSRARRSTRRAIRFGTVLENVVLDPVTREPDFDDDSPDREHPRRPIRSTSSRTPSRTGRAGIRRTS